jgi:L-alanine-DL-glutamate epimerase-like enolase superfamily enzyme
MGRGPLKVKHLEYERLHGRRTAVTGVDRQPMVVPHEVYAGRKVAEYRDLEPRREEVPITYIYLRVLASNDVEGLYGPIDVDAAFAIERLFKQHVVGADVLPYSRLWDNLYLRRGYARAGRSTMAALSAVDNVLWDLRGKYYETPACALLGGPTREEVPVYASCKNYSHHPEDLERRIAKLKKAGYRGFKYFFSYGPAASGDGLRKNIELARDLRNAAGDDCQIMFDAYMSWNLSYASAWVKAAEPYSPAFVEECFPPRRLHDYKRLREITTIPIATGEHLYGREDIRPFLQQEALDILQCDPEWCGGLSEFARVATLAAPFGVRVIPHGQSLHAALHGISSQPGGVCPMMEYLVSYMQYRHFFEKNVPRPRNGGIQAPSRPGFGIELDRGKIEKRTLLSWN